MYKSAFYVLALVTAVSKAMYVQNPSYGHASYVV